MTTRIGKAQIAGLRFLLHERLKNEVIYEVEFKTS